MQTLAKIPAATLAVALACLASIDLAASPTSPSQISYGMVPTLPTSDGITVVGKGSATVVFDTALVEIKIEEQEKSMLQTMTDFRAKSTLFEKAVAEFVEEGATIERQGVVLGLRQASRNNFVMNGEAPPAAPFQAKEMVQVKLPTGGDMDAALTMIADLVAAADDVNCKLGDVDPNAVFYSPNNKTPGPIRFIASDEAVQAAQTLALADLYKDAERRADELAALAGGKRGAARSVSVVQSVDGTKEGTGEAKKTASLSVRFDLDY